VFQLKRAWTSAAAPLSIMRPTNYAIPPDCRHIFINNRDATVAQNATHFIKQEPRILRVMQYVAEQHGVEAFIFDGKMAAIVWKIIDPSGSDVAADVQAYDRRTQQALKMMRDEAVAAADVEHVRSWRQHTRYFERHVIRSPDFAAPSHTLEATFDGGCQTRH